MTDESLLKQSQSNPKMFENIVEKYQSAFLRRALKIARNKEDAEDIVQDTFVKIYSASKKFHKVKGASAKSWMYKILMNTSFTWCSKNKKEVNIRAQIDDEILAIVPDIANLTMQEKSLDTDYLISLLGKLPMKIRKIMRMHFIDGIPQKKVAKIENISENLVRTRIHRGKLALRLILANNIAYRM